MKPKELTIRGVVLGALITTVFTAALGPWLGLLAFVGLIILLYGWMLRKSAATN